MILVVVLFQPIIDRSHPLVTTYSFQLQQVFHIPEKSFFMPEFTHRKGCRTLADFFVVELQIFIGANRVKICRDNLPHLSRLTAFRLRAESSNRDGAYSLLCWTPCWKRRLFIWFSWQFLIGWGTHQPRQTVLVHCTLVDMARQDVLRSSTVRHGWQAPIL